MPKIMKIGQGAFGHKRETDTHADDMPNGRIETSLIYYPYRPSEVTSIRPGVSGVSFLYCVLFLQKEPNVFKILTFPRIGCIVV